MKELHDNWLATMPPIEKMPKLDLPPAPPRPATMRENFDRFYRGEKPLWLPMASECNTIIPEVVCERPALNKGGKDWFGVDWTFVEEVGTPSVTPGSQLFSEIEDWRERVVFPCLDAIDWEAAAELSQQYILPDRQTATVLFMGCFERLHSLMGFEDALCAMASEPEETLELINAIADHKIRLIDKLLTHFPIDRVIYHDDWGTQRAAFFSNEMFLQLLYEPTKRIVDYTHSRGALFTMHCCGCVESLVPYMMEMDIDSWDSAQMAINDLATLRQSYGTKLKFETRLDHPTLDDPNSTEERVRACVGRIIRTLGSEGGLCFSRLACHPKHMWAVHEEAHKVSAELYGA